MVWQCMLCVVYGILGILVYVHMWYMACVVCGTWVVCACAMGGIAHHVWCDIAHVMRVSLPV